MSTDALNVLAVTLASLSTLGLVGLTAWYAKSTVALKDAAQGSLLLAEQSLRLAQRSLSLDSYSKAIDNLVAVKSRFADDADHFAGAMKEINKHERMGRFANDPARFLLYAGSLWRFSFVYSVMTDETNLLSAPERDGLEAELDLWLGLPGFEDVYRQHSAVLRAHNPDFLAFLKGKYHPPHGEPHGMAGDSHSPGHPQD